MSYTYMQFKKYIFYAYDFISNVKQIALHLNVQSGIYK